MLSWNIHYEVAAIVFLSMLVLYFILKKYVKTTLNRWFIRVLVFTLISAALDITTAVTLSLPHIVPVWINYILNVVYLVSTFTVTVSTFIYTMLFVGNTYIVRFKRLLPYLIPAILETFAIVSSPITHFIFYFDDYGAYQHGNVWLLQFATHIFYIAAMLVAVFKHRKTVNRFSYYSLYALNGITVLFMLLQALFFNWCLLTYFGAALSGFIIYFSMQSQDYYMDIEKGVQNKYALTTIVNELFIEQKKFHIAVFEADELTDFARLNNSDFYREITNSVIATFRRHLNENQIFAVANNRYVLICDRDECDIGRLDRLINNFADGIAVGETSLCIEPYITVFSCPRDAGTTDELLNLIPFAVNEARRKGKGNITITDHRIVDRIDRSLAIRKAIARALENDSFEVYFQPLYSIEKKCFVGAEALARLYDEELGWIPPIQFIEEAELDGTIIQVGSQIFEKVCRYISSWDMEGLGLECISVNLSPMQCLQPDIVQQLTNIAERYEVPLSYINLEITETVEISSQARVSQIMHELAGSSVTFSLDDYGTGYSNLGYILSLPFQVIKLDRTVINAHFDNLHGFLSHIVSMFHGFDLKIVAEGVETEEQATVLKEMGCDILQGYYFSKPIPSGEFINLVVGRRAFGETQF